MRFFRLRGRELWGDYGDVLLGGFALRSGEDATEQLTNRSSPLLLQRTGPFVPPISFPRENIVVSDEFKNTIQQSSQVSFDFKPVVKSRITQSDWHTWDWTTDAPKDSGEEPESYVLDRPHSDEVSREMGELWEVVLRHGARVTSHTEVEAWIWHYYLVIDASSWNGDAVFIGYSAVTDAEWIIVAEPFKDYLDTFAHEWIAFDDVFTKPIPPKAYYSMDRMGNIETEPSVERIHELVKTLSEERHDGNYHVELAHASGWCLHAHCGGQMWWRNTRDRGGWGEMESVTSEKAVLLLLKLTTGAIEEIKQEPWRWRRI